MSATRSNLAALLLTVTLLAVASQATAEEVARRVTLTLLVTDVRGERDTPEQVALRKQKLAQEVVRRLRARLDAAGVKHADLLITEAAHVQVTVITREDRRWIEGLALAPGALAVRPVLRAGEQWAALGSYMPDSVELRQEEGSVDPRDGYLWSAKSAPLVSFVKANPLKQGATFVVPEGAGWRTLTLGEATITHHDVMGVSVEQDSTGGAWARIALATAVQTRWTAGDPTSTPSWAVVLDGEVLDRIQGTPPEQLRAELRLRCPATSAARPAQRACVGQIAGRLASHIPVMLTPYKYEEQR